MEHNNHNINISEKTRARYSISRPDIATRVKNEKKKSRTIISYFAQLGEIKNTRATLFFDTQKQIKIKKLRVFFEFLSPLFLGLLHQQKKTYKYIHTRL